MQTDFWDVREVKSAGEMVIRLDTALHVADPELVGLAVIVKHNGL